MITLAFTDRGHIIYDSYLTDKGRYIYDAVTETGASTFNVGKLVAVNFDTEQKIYIQPVSEYNMNQIIYADLLMNYDAMQSIYNECSDDMDFAIILVNLYRQKIKQSVSITRAIKATIEI